MNACNYVQAVLSLGPSLAAEQFVFTFPTALTALALETTARSGERSELRTSCFWGLGFLGSKLRVAFIGLSCHVTLLGLCWAIALLPQRDQKQVREEPRLQVVQRNLKGSPWNCH